MSNKYLTTKQVCNRFNISTRTLHRWRTGEHASPFPSPKMTGRGSNNRWLLSDIESWEKEGYLIGIGDAANENQAQVA